MSDGKATRARDARRKTRYRGISYRERADGTRTYYVYAGGRHVAVQGGEAEAKAKQAELRTRVARGETVATGNVMFEHAAEEWLASKTRLRARTRAGYRAALDNHLLPYFGGMKMGRIRAETVAEFIRDMERKRPQGRKRDDRLSGWTIQGVLVPLSGIVRFSIRRGYMGFDPLAQLEREERPTKPRREMRVLAPDEIRALIVAASTRYRPLLLVAVSTGLRLGELLGLRWGDVDLTSKTIRVRRQVTPTGTIEEPKTAASAREVMIVPEVERALADVWGNTPHSRDDDPVFASSVGTPLSQRNVTRRGLQAAVKAAGLRAPTPRFHDLRHTYASMLIDRGCTPEDVCAQMGHTNPSVTLSIYTHQFDKARSRERILAAITPTVASLWQVEVGNGEELGEDDSSGIGSNRPFDVEAGSRRNRGDDFPS
jgi:integrase